MFSDERGQGAREGYFSDIPVKYGGQRRMWCTMRQHAEVRFGGLYVHCNSIVLILYF